MRTILLGITGNLTDEVLDYSLHELKALAENLDYEIVYNVRQTKDKPENATYIGTGKIEELKILIKEYKAEIIIVDDTLTPAQNRNLGLLLDIDVIDRSFLILEIFEKRAKTSEAKLEITLAKYKYLLNRTFLFHEKQSREGGTSGSLSNKGKGETKRELDRRYLENNIIRLERELENLNKKKENQVTRRKKNGIPIVSLVGYTNAGKSSTMNSLIEYIGDDINKKVYEKDELFATLDTYSRRLKYKNLPFILTDTIGFVSKLPTTLITSFYQTLAEVKYSDLIIYVIDLSSNFAFIEFQITYNVLQEIGANNIPFLLLFTKIDKANSNTTLPAQILNFITKDNKENVVYKEYICSFINNKTKDGINSLTEGIYKALSQNYYHVKVNIPYTDGKLINLIEEKADILTKTYFNDYIYYDLYISDKYYPLIAIYEIDEHII